MFWNVISYQRKGDLKLPNRYTLLDTQHRSIAKCIANIAVIRESLIFTQKQHIQANLRVLRSCNAFWTGVCPTYGKGLIRSDNSLYSSNTYGTRQSICDYFYNCTRSTWQTSRQCFPVCHQLFLTSLSVPSIK